MNLNPKDEAALSSYLNLLKAHKGNLEAFKAIEPILYQLDLLDIFGLFNQRLKSGESIEDILSYVDRFIHVVDTILRSKESQLPTHGFIGHLVAENTALKAKLSDLQDILKSNRLENLDREALAHDFKELETFHPHYIKTQNLLFPSLEKIHADFEGLKILWSLQDQGKRALKELIHILQAENPNYEILAIALGDYFFTAYGLIQKEERFLLQSAQQFLTASTLHDLELQSHEYPFCFIETPTKPHSKKQAYSTPFGLFQTPTGELNFDQLELILNMIPLDCTFIDEDNKVRYFNNPKDRLFPRSSAVIGRDVRNCHPASSVHVVDQIIEAFRSNTKDEANFWIQMKGHFVYIRYFALRDDKKVYKGTLEVTQIVDDIRALVGERRLLEWQ